MVKGVNIIDKAIMAIKAIKALKAFKTMTKTAKAMVNSWYNICMIFFCELFLA